MAMFAYESIGNLQQEWERLGNSLTLVSFFESCDRKFRFFLVNRKHPCPPTTVHGGKGTVIIGYMCVNFFAFLLGLAGYQ